MSSDLLDQTLLCSRIPIAWISLESTSLQKSFLLSDPSRRRRSLGPITAMTVAMQVEVKLRGSCASNFMPGRKSLVGGVGY